MPQDWILVFCCFMGVLRFDCHYHLLSILPFQFLVFPNCRTMPVVVLQHAFVVLPACRCVFVLSTYLFGQNRTVQWDIIIKSKRYLLRVKGIIRIVYQNNVPKYRHNKYLINMYPEQIQVSSLTMASVTTTRITIIPQRRKLATITLR